MTPMQTARRDKIRENLDNPAGFHVTLRVSFPMENGRACLWAFAGHHVSECIKIHGGPQMPPAGKGGMEDNVVKKAGWMSPTG